MLSPAHKLLLFLSLAPYLGLAAYDGWLHEKARQVPVVEKILHALIAVAVAVVVWALFFAHPAWAWPALAVFALAGAFDEFGFHRQLHHHERRLHYIAYAGFGVFVASATALGALRWE